MKYCMLLYGLLFFTLAHAQKVYYTLDGTSRVPKSNLAVFKDLAAAKFTRVFKKPMSLAINSEKTEKRQDSVIHYITLEFIDQASTAKSGGMQRFKSNALPPFRLADLQGNATMQEKYNGKLTMINFWYTSCAPCMEEMPFLNQLAAAHQGEFDFVAITYEPLEKVEKFLEKYPLILRSSSTPNPIRTIP